MTTITLTLTPEKARTLTIPATDELLRGWVGPGIYTDNQEVRDIACLGLGKLGWVAAGYYWPAANEAGVQGVPIAKVALPLRPEVIDRMYRVMAAGVRCPHPAGLQWPQQAIVSGHRWVVCGQCNAHNGEPGYLHPPADLSAFRNIKAEGWGVELEAALLYLSWARMAGGMRPIRGWLGPLREDWRDGVMYAPKRDFVGGEHRGHAYCGPDDRPLSEGFALLDITPEGPVIRAEVPDAVR